MIRGRPARAVDRNSKKLRPPFEPIKRSDKYLIEGSAILRGTALSRYILDRGTRTAAVLLDSIYRAKAQGGEEKKRNAAASKEDPVAFCHGYC